MVPYTVDIRECASAQFPIRTFNFWQLRAVMKKKLDQLRAAFEGNFFMFSWAKKIKREYQIEYTKIDKRGDSPVVELDM